MPSQQLTLETGIGCVVCLNYQHLTDYQIADDSHFALSSAFCVHIKE